MGEHTSIGWTHHTFNPWWGCTPAGPECDACYARAFAERFPRSRGLWGRTAPRLMASERGWAALVRWNRAAEAARERRGVFVASMADILEERPDLTAPRARLWAMVPDLPWLDLLVLTKRPEGFRTRVPQGWHTGHWPRNVIAGTTCGTVAGLVRVRTLLDSAAPAPARFVSAEPLLEHVNWRAVFFDERVRWPGACRCGHGHGFTRCPNYGSVSQSCHVLGCRCPGFRRAGGEGIDLLIPGGESRQPGCPPPRPCNLAWIRSAIEQARAAGVRVFVKQLGARPFDFDETGLSAGLTTRFDPPTHAWLHLGDRAAGANPAEWPADVRVRETYELPA